MLPVLWLLPAKQRLITNQRRSPSKFRFLQTWPTARGSTACSTSRWHCAETDTTGLIVSAAGGLQAGKIGGSIAAQPAAPSRANHSTWPLTPARSRNWRRDSRFTRSTCGPVDQRHQQSQQPGSAAVPHLLGCRLPAPPKFLRSLQNSLITGLPSFRSGNQRTSPPPAL